MGREVMRVREGAPFGMTGAPIKRTRGKFYQMWQTVSDQPYTPAFKTPEELARWCADHPWGMEVENPVPYESWLKFIKGPGWAPSMMGMAGNVTSGVEYMANKPT